MANAKIKAVRARQIIDCKCRPMVEVDVVTDDGYIGTGAAPTGIASWNTSANTSNFASICFNVLFSFLIFLLPFAWFYATKIMRLLK